MLANRSQWKRYLRIVQVKRDPAEEKKPIHFYVLAHGGPHDARFDALSLALTRVQPDLRFGDPIVRRARAATYDVSDARRMAFSLYLSLFKDLTLQSIDGLKRTEVEAGKAELVFVPCRQGRNELSDLVVGVTLQMATS